MNAWNSRILEVGKLCTSAIQQAGIYLNSPLLLAIVLYDQLDHPPLHLRRNRHRNACETSDLGLKIASSTLRLSGS